MSSEEFKTTLEINLLDNGVDFILKGIDELFDEEHVFREYSNATDISDNSYKYGVLHLFSGFLLLLKERLSRHLPELIFKGKLNEVKQKLSSGKKTPNTVDLDEALERLEIGPKVIFSDDQLKVIRAVQDFRNKFEHYQVSINRYALWKEVTQFLELIEKFLSEELQINIEASAKNTKLQQKIRTIGAVQRRIEEQEKKEWHEDAESRLERFQLRRDKVIQELEQEYRGGEGVYPFTICPDCDLDTLITLGEFEGICIDSECESVNPLAECLRCGTVMAGWDSGFCESCLEWIGDQ